MWVTWPVGAGLERPACPSRTYCSVHSEDANRGGLGIDAINHSTCRSIELVRDTECAACQVHKLSVRGDSDYKLWELRRTGVSCL